MKETNRGLESTFSATLNEIESSNLMTVMQEKLICPPITDTVVFRNSSVFNYLSGLVASGVETQEEIESHDVFLRNMLGSKYTGQELDFKVDLMKGLIKPHYTAILQEVRPSQNH